MRAVDQPDALSFAVFPFLKTSSPLEIGELTFRSVRDSGTLQGDDLERLHEVSRMFFLRDDLRIAAPIYAVFVPSVAISEQLSDIQAVIAYVYSMPDEVTGHPAFHSENASLIILSPEPIYLPSLREEDLTESVIPNSYPEPPDPECPELLPGYEGVYNFRWRFQCASGSRIYPPGTSVTLSHSQDLYENFNQIRAAGGSAI